MEDVLWVHVLVLEVPDEGHSVGVIGGVFVSIVRSYKQFWVLEYQDYI